MGYKVGDTVLILPELNKGHSISICIITDDMIRFAGKKTTIKEVFDDGTYYCDIDNGEYYWPENVLISTTLTIADKIRSMSDEELAKFLSEFSACGCCKYKDEERDACGAPWGSPAQKNMPRRLLGTGFSTRRSEVRKNQNRTN